MKLGIVIQHYDARNDVREVLGLLAQHHEVVLFGHENKLREVSASFERRVFTQKVRISDRMWLQAYSLLGALPFSRQSYFLNEYYKLSGLSNLRKLISSARLWVRMRVPARMSFDFLLDRLKGSDGTRIDDIDLFVVITELSSPQFLSHLLSAGKKVCAYVYSWDHVPKHAYCSRRVDRWLVWHDGIADDLRQLQGIRRDRIGVVGATQLAYVHEYLMNPERRKPKRTDQYIYYGCGVGYPAMAWQEAKLIGHLAQALKEADPTVTLVVRPYPMLAETHDFLHLRALPNVQFDEDYRIGKSDRSLRRDEIFDRLNLQEHAVAFFHCRTTMGLEGAYFDSPVVLLNPRNFDYGISPMSNLHLSRLLDQHHIKRYMVLQGYGNLITRKEDLLSTLIAVLSDPSAFLEYNRALVKSAPVVAFSDIVRRMSFEFTQQAQ